MTRSPAPPDDAIANHAVQVGVGLWSLRSTVYRPAPWPRLHAELRDDARLAEDLGYDSLWLAEHHGSYDGWCPQPLVAAASVLAATSTMRVGTAMLLLPQHDVTDIGRQLATLADLHGQRLDLGVGLGYRADEFDAFAIARRHRGRLMDTALGTLVSELHQDAAGRPSLYVGGTADAAVRRAGRHGAGLLLPNSLSVQETRTKITLARESAAGHGRRPGRTGMLVDVWPTDGSVDARRQAVEQLVVHYREYTGAWFTLRGHPAFSAPELLDKQSERTRRAAVVGTADKILTELLVLHGAGIDTFVLQVRGGRSPSDYRRAMRQLADHVVPALKASRS